jgi:UDP:flavonoid glycosyltransferase YjiC (YdhE family)
LPPKFNIQKVLIAPLDWGLGHATRCIPIIKALVNNGYTVSIAAEGAQANLLQNEFPNLVILPLKGYRVRYSKSKWALPFRLLWQVPKLLQIIRYERNWLANTIKEHNIDLVISDNRYGLSSKTIPCIFITHQLTIKMPFAWLEKQVQQINYRYINRFTRCWVPDVLGGVTAAGKLSHPASLPNTKIQYTGLLSRFQKRAVGKIIRPGTTKKCSGEKNNQ